MEQLLEMSRRLRTFVGKFKINTDGSGIGTAAVANLVVQGKAAHASV